MCDIVPGEIMVGYPVDGPGRGIYDRVVNDLFGSGMASNGPRLTPNWQDATSSDSLSEGDGLVMPMHDGLPVVLRRMTTVAGSEQAAVDAINRRTLEESVRYAAAGGQIDELLYPLQRVFAQTVHYLKPCHEEQNDPVQPFRLTSTHERYLKQIVHLGGPAIGPAPRVAIIDGGFDDQFCLDHTFGSQVLPIVEFGHQPPGPNACAGVVGPDAATV